MNRSLVHVLFTAALFAAWGCASSKPSKLADASTTVAPVPGSSVDAEPSLRGRMLQAVGDVAPVYFGYDSSELSEQARATLTKNTAWLKEHENVRVQVGGHCDQRGTEAYNLALGQRRALKVRSYYMTLGLRGDRMATTSYGKNMPTCLDSTEACWQQNRRAETLVTFEEDVSSRPHRRR